MDALGLEYC